MGRGEGHSTVTKCAKSGRPEQEGLNGRRNPKQPGHRPNQINKLHVQETLAKGIVLLAHRTAQESPLVTLARQHANPGFDGRRITEIRRKPARHTETQWAW